MQISELKTKSSFINTPEKRNDSTCHRETGQGQKIGYTNAIKIPDLRINLNNSRSTFCTTIQVTE